MSLSVERRAKCIAGNSRGSFLEGRFINIDQSPITRRFLPLRQPFPQIRKTSASGIRRRCAWSYSQNVPEVGLRCAVCAGEREAVTEVILVKMMNRLSSL